MDFIIHLLLLILFILIRIKRLINRHSCVSLKISNSAGVKLTSRSSPEAVSLLLGHKCNDIFTPLVQLK
jgi:flagellar biogenesis protein FliO